ncbi:MAG: hypothetical protein J6Y43_05225, partial [Clostridia bacterium]|nr:hypothetical protein [Clostridia bacterium]
MNIILSEKTVDGIATAIFISYADKLFPVRIEEKGVIQPAFSDNFISFMPSREKAARVKKALVKYGGLSIIPEIKLCLLSCETDCLTTAFNYACKFLDCKKDVSDNFADPVVLKFHDTVRKV